MNALWHAWVQKAWVLEGATCSVGLRADETNIYVYFSAFVCLAWTCDESHYSTAIKLRSTYFQDYSRSNLGMFSKQRFVNICRCNDALCGKTPGTKKIWYKCFILSKNAILFSLNLPILYVVDKLRSSCSVAMGCFRDSILTLQWYRVDNVGLRSCVRNVISESTSKPPSNSI